MELADLALIACASTKLNTPMPAGQLYQSSLFKKSVRYAERHASRWMILSAKHGLLDPLKVIEPYDLTLNDLKRAECREWARSVHRQLIEGDFVRPESVILWLAGEKYQKDLRELLTGCRHKDPLSSMRIGQRLKFLTDALSADGRAVDPDGA